MPTPDCRRAFGTGLQRRNAPIDVAGRSDSGMLPGRCHHCGIHYTARPVEPATICSHCAEHGAMWNAYGRGDGGLRRRTVTYKAAPDLESLRWQGTRPSRPSSAVRRRGRSVRRRGRPRRRPRRSRRRGCRGAGGRCRTSFSSGRFRVSWVGYHSRFHSTGAPPALRVEPGFGRSAPVSAPRREGYRRQRRPHPDHRSDTPGPDRQPSDAARWSPLASRR